MASSASKGLEGRVALEEVLIPNPTFKVVARPGAWEDFYKHGNPEGKSRRELTGDPIRSPEAYFSPEPRLALMDELGLDRAPDVADAGQPAGGPAAHGSEGHLHRYPRAACHRPGHLRHRCLDDRARAPLAVPCPEHSPGRERLRMGAPVHGRPRRLLRAEDPHGLVKLMGADRVIFGSDYPHPEACPSRFPT
jgi:hypothetical protein